MNTAGKEDWQSASVTNCAIVEDPSSRQPRSDLPHCSWSLLNCYHTGQGTCKASLYKRGLSKSSNCSFRDPLPRTILWTTIRLFEGSLTILHEAEDDAVKCQLVGFRECWNKTEDKNYSHFAISIKHSFSAVLELWTRNFPCTQFGWRVNVAQETGGWAGR